MHRYLPLSVLASSLFLAISSYALTQDSFQRAEQLDAKQQHQQQHQEDQLGQSLVGTGFGLRGGWKWFNYDVFVGKALRAPEGFRTKNKIVGFNFSASF